MRVGNYTPLASDFSARIRPGDLFFRLETAGEAARLGDE